MIQTRLESMVSSESSLDSTWISFYSLLLSFFFLSVVLSFSFGGRTFWSFQTLGLSNWVAKSCKNLSSELGFRSEAMRGFQKGITLCSRHSRSASKVLGGVGWVVLSIIVPLQSRLGVRSLKFRVRSLSGLRLDFRLTISKVSWG